MRRETAIRLADATPDSAVADAPLDGLLVADFSRILAGPLVGMTLGDLGADVVKVEAPAGDDTRTWGPPFDSDGSATYHQSVNRNKRSVVLDLKDPVDCELARTLCTRADVVVANFRPGTLEEFGLGYDDVSRENPACIYCEISGFGEAGGRHLPGYDPLAQALGGLMSVTGPAEEPYKVGVALVDMIAGLYATVAVMAALRERERSRRGQRVTINLMHATLAALANQGAGWLGAHSQPQRLGNAHPSIEPFGTYKAADGDLMICAGNDRQFRSLAVTIGAPKLADEPQFATNDLRVSNRELLRPLIERRLRRAACANWTNRLTAAGVPAGPVKTVPEAFEYAAELGLKVIDDTGGARTVAFPAELSRTPAVTRRAPPRLDEDGPDIRNWLDTDSTR